jgi:hypothetical protein
MKTANLLAILIALLAGVIFEKESTAGRACAAD